MMSKLPGETTLRKEFTSMLCSFVFNAAVEAINKTDTDGGFGHHSSSS